MHLLKPVQLFMLGATLLLLGSLLLRSQSNTVSPLILNPINQSSGG